MSKRAQILTYVNLPPAVIHRLLVARLVQAVWVFPRPYAWAAEGHEGRIVQVFDAPLPYPPPRPLKGDGATSG